MGVKAALLVAVSQFKDPRFNDLRAPVTDTEDLKRILESTDIGDYDVKPLLNPVSHELRFALEKFFQTRMPDDILLLYFSGHGVKDSRGDLHLITRDSQLEYLQSTAVAASYVNNQIELSRSQNVVVLLDCCYSGAFARNKVARSAMLSPVDIAEFSGKGTAVLTASNATEYAFEGNDLTVSKGASSSFTSYFTRALVNGLETGAADLNADERVSVAELYKYIFDQVREHNPDQHPTGSIKTQGDLIIAKAPKRIRSTLQEFNYFRVGEFRQTILRVDSEVYCVKFSPDRSVIAAGSEEAALLWSLPTTEGLEPLHALSHPRFVYSVVFSSDGKTLITGCEDRAVRFWNWSTEELLKEDWTAHDDSVYAVAISGDGRYLATGGYDGRVNLWNMDEFTQLDSRRLEGRVSSLAFPWEGEVLAIGTHDDKIVLWDLAADKIVPLGTHDSSVESVAFSSDGHLLASCGLDKRVCLWDVATKTRLWAKKSHKYVVKSVTFSPDNKVIASASWDTTVRLWDVAGRGVSQKIPWWGDERMRWHSDWIWAISFSHDGRMIATAGSDGMVALWTIGE